MRWPFHKQPDPGPPDRAAAGADPSEDSTLPVQPAAAGAEPPDQAAAPEPPAELLALDFLGEPVWWGSAGTGEHLWTWSTALPLEEARRRIADQHAEHGWLAVNVGHCPVGEFLSALDTPEEAAWSDGAADLDAAVRLVDPFGTGLALDDVPDGDPREPAPVSMKVSDSGMLGTVRAEAYWQLPALLGFQGGVNLHIDPGLHSAVLRHWDRRYGVELVELNGDEQRMIIKIRHPPTDPETARALAIELLRYCPDLTDGTDVPRTIADVAASVAPASVWALWWD